MRQLQLDGYFMTRETLQWGEDLVNQICHGSGVSSQMHMQSVANRIFYSCINEFVKYKYVELISICSSSV